MSVYDDARRLIRNQREVPVVDYRATAAAYGPKIAQALIDLMEEAEIGHSRACDDTRKPGLHPDRCDLCATLRRIKEETT